MLAVRTELRRLLHEHGTTSGVVAVAPATAPRGFSFLDLPQEYLFEQVSDVADDSLTLSSDSAEVWCAHLDSVEERLYQACLECVWKSARIICGTAAQSRRIASSLEHYHCGRVVVWFDEMSMAPDAAILRTLRIKNLYGFVGLGCAAQGFPYDRRMVAGDRVVAGQSLFQAMACPETTLNVQYRCSAAIGSLWSKVFYEDKVLNGPNTLEMERKQEFPPLVLLDTQHFLSTGVECRAADQEYRSNIIV